MYKCRLASTEDFEWVVDVAARKMLQEEVEKAHYYDPTTIEGLVQYGIEAGTLWVVEVDGCLVGALGAFISPHVFNANLSVLTEVFWWVDKEHRGSRAGALLLGKFVEKAEEHDEASLSLLVGSNINHQALQKRGFKMLETSFVRSR